MQVCTVDLEVLIKNYLVNGVDKTFDLKNDEITSASWRSDFLTNIKNLLSNTETNVIGTLRKEFMNGNAKKFLNDDIYNQILNSHSEGKEYCIRVIADNETLCILSKREIK